MFMTTLASYLCVVWNTENVSFKLVTAVEAKGDKCDGGKAQDCCYRRSY